MTEQKLRRVIREEIEQLDEDYKSFGRGRIKFIPAVGLVLETEDVTVEIHAWWEDVKDALSRAMESRSTTEIEANEIEFKGNLSKLTDE
jgi:hypothetical protein